MTTLDELLDPVQEDDEYEYAEARSDVAYYETRLLLLVIILTLCFTAWVVSYDNPLRRLQRQLDAATQVVPR